MLRISWRSLRSARHRRWYKVERGTFISSAIRLIGSPTSRVRVMRSQLAQVTHPCLAAPRTSCQSIRGSAAVSAEAVAGATASMTVGSFGPSVARLFGLGVLRVPRLGRFLADRCYVASQHLAVHYREDR